MTYLSVSSVSGQLHRSVRWVYLHAAELGAARIGGTWIFTQEGLDNVIQKSWRVEGRSTDGKPTQNNVVSIEERRTGMGKRKKKGIEKPETEDRHGIAAAFNGVS